MSTPAAFQSPSSAKWVPDLSPRETKAAFLRWIDVNATAISGEPLMPAGSLLGPIRTKSLYITSKRLTPKPCSTNFSSCALAWTKTTSASPRRPASSAWPVPCATTLTSIPDFAVNKGSMWSKRPESVSMSSRPRRSTVPALADAPLEARKVKMTAIAVNSRRFSTGSSVSAIKEQAPHR